MFVDCCVGGGWYIWYLSYRRNPTGQEFFVPARTLKAVKLLTTQCTNWRILTSAKKIQFRPSTHVIDAASFVEIASNIGQAEVIARSMRYQTL